VAIADVGTKIAEDATAQRAGPRGRRLEHAHACERSGKALLGVLVELGFFHGPASAFIVEAEKKYTR
jgi:hypothetical protein